MPTRAFGLRPSRARERPRSRETAARRTELEASGGSQAHPQDRSSRDDKRPITTPQSCFVLPPVLDRRRRGALKTYGARCTRARAGWQLTLDEEKSQDARLT